MSLACLEDIRSIHKIQLYFCILAMDNQNDTKKIISFTIE